MSKSRYDLEQDAIIAGRESGISNVLFRNTVSSSLGLRATDMMCLDLLFYRKVASPTQLASYCNLTSGATTAMLDRLENAGMVARQPNPGDRRGVIIKILPSAAVQISPLFRSVRTAQHDLLKKYTDNELRLLNEYFTRVTEIWESGRRDLEDGLQANPPVQTRQPEHDLK